MTDRRATPFFVGRRSEIEDVETALTQAFQDFLDGVTDPAAGGMRLIQEAPGAGKTVLLTHLRDRWAVKGETAPLAVVIDPAEDLRTPGNLARCIAAVAASDGTGGPETGTAGSSIGVGISVAGAEARYRKQRSVTWAPASAREILRELKWKRPLALMIDEVQNLRRPYFKLL